MKPIIMDMKEMSDSTEVYESRPNPFIIYFIYFLVAMFGIAIMWMAFSKIDIVVKSSGMIKSDNEIYDVSSSITGKIVEVNVKDGQFVNEGDVLYTLEVISLGETIKYYQSEYNNVNARLKILHAYVNYLDGDSKALDAFSDNVYYKEISNRKELFDINKNVSTENKPEIASCEENIVILEESILQYEGKIEKLNQVNNCIASRNNTFSNDDSYYKSLVDSYISNYNLTESQYDKSILEFEKLLEEYNKQVNKADFATEISETTAKIESLNIEKELASADLVVTGEGRLDSQTVQGKAPITVAKLAKKYEKKVIAFCGSLGTGAELCNEHGIDAFFPVLRTVTTLEEAMEKEQTKRNLSATVEQVFRLIHCGQIAK